jgi:anti-sigma regulatory factor (Ser/Thr protein kinase)
MDVSQQLYSEPRLKSCIGKSAGVPEQLTGEILEDVEAYAGEAEQADDITILAFRLDQAPGKQDAEKLHMVTATDLAEIERINTEFKEFADGRGLAAGVSQKVSIVLDDLLNNIISYGYSDDEDHQIDIDVTYTPGRLVIAITDDGMPFNPFDQVGPDTSLSVEERDIGGLGVLLVKELMDEYQYQRHSNSNVVTLTLFLDS